MFEPQQWYFDEMLENFQEISGETQREISALMYWGIFENVYDIFHRITHDGFLKAILWINRKYFFKSYGNAWNKWKIDEGIIIRFFGKM